MTIFSVAFAKAAAERAVKTAAQAVLAVITTDAISSAFDIDPEQVAGVALLGALASFLTSVVSSPLGPEGSPSLVTDRAASNP